MVAVVVLDELVDRVQELQRMVSYTVSFVMGQVEYVERFGETIVVEVGEVEVLQDLVEVLLTHRPNDGLAVGQHACDEGLHVVVQLRIDGAGDAMHARQAAAFKVSFAFAADALDELAVEVAHAVHTFAGYRLVVCKLVESHLCRLLHVVDVRLDERLAVA